MYYTFFKIASQLHMTTYFLTYILDHLSLLQRTSTICKNCKYELKWKGRCQKTVKALKSLGHMYFTWGYRFKSWFILL